MGDLIYSVEPFAEAMSEWDEAAVNTWIHKLLFRECIHPLALAFPITGERLIIQIYAENGTTSPAKRNLETAVARSYEEFSAVFPDTSVLSRKGNEELGSDFFLLIGRMGINQLYDLLQREAIEGKYKGTATIFSTKDRWDLHTYLLKAIFALEPKNKAVLTTIVERDIHDLRYSSECFNAVNNVLGNVFSGLQYLPVLVSQVEGANRPIKSELLSYVQALEKAELGSGDMPALTPLTTAEVRAYSGVLTALNPHLNSFKVSRFNGYNLQIDENGLVITNATTDTARVINLTPEVTSNIRSSLRYVTEPTG